MLFYVLLLCINIDAFLPQFGGLNGQKSSKILGQHGICCNGSILNGCRCWAGDRAKPKATRGIPPSHSPLNNMSTAQAVRLFARGRGLRQIGFRVSRGIAGRFAVCRPPCRKWRLPLSHLPRLWVQRPCHGPHRPPCACGNPLVWHPLQHLSWRLFRPCQARQIIPIAALFAPAIAA